MQLTFIILNLLLICLKYYVCNSNEYIACTSDDNLNSFIQTCEETIEPYCRKIEQTVDKRISIIRTCGSKIGTQACYKTAGLNNVHVCSCNKDLCNHGKTLNQ